MLLTKANLPTWLERLPYIFAIITLFSGLIQTVQTDEIIMIALTLLLIAGNLTAAITPTRFPVFLPISVNVLDGVMSFYVTWSLVQAGKAFIQYAYFLAGCLFFLVALRLAFRSRKGIEGT